MMHWFRHLFGRGKPNKATAPRCVQQPIIQSTVPTRREVANGRNVDVAFEGKRDALLVTAVMAFDVPLVAGWQRSERVGWSDLATHQTRWLTVFSKMGAGSERFTLFFPARQPYVLTSVNQFENARMA